MGLSPYMLAVPGYTLLHKIYEDPAIIVCHASSLERSGEVLLKIVKEGPKAMYDWGKNYGQNVIWTDGNHEFLCK